MLVQFELVLGVGGPRSPLIMVPGISVVHNVIDALAIVVGSVCVCYRRRWVALAIVVGSDCVCYRRRWVALAIVVGSHCACSRCRRAASAIVDGPIRWPDFQMW